MMSLQRMLEGGGTQKIASKVLWCLAFISNIDTINSITLSIPIIIILEEIEEKRGAL